eukprot:4674991-Prymnesium_polylepis.1
MCTGGGRGGGGHLLHRREAQLVLHLVVADAQMRQLQTPSGVEQGRLSIGDRGSSGWKSPSRCARHACTRRRGELKAL